MARRPARLPPGVVRRGDRYHIWWKDANGNRRWRAAGGDAREASRVREELARNARRALAGLEEETSQEVVLADLRTEYVETLRERCKPMWVTNVGNGLDVLLDLLRARRVSDLRKPDLEKARARLVEDGRAHRTANKMVGFLLAMLRWAEDTGRIGRNPIPRLRKLEEGGEFQRKRRYRLTVEEARRLQVAADELRVGGRKGAGSPIGDLVALALATGIRIQEGLHLRWSDVHRDAIVIRAATTKNRKSREVPMTASLAERLVARKMRAGRLLGRLPTPEDHVFLSPRAGAPLTNSGGPTRCHYWLRKALEAAGVDRVRGDGSTIDWHSLRHSFCCWLVEAGAAPQAVQAIMGHSSVEVTMRVYADLDRTPKRSAIDLLPDIDGKPSEGSKRGSSRA